MHRTKIKQTGSFEALGDDGRRHIVYEYTEFHDGSDITTPEKWLPGMVSYELVNGDHINVLADGSMRVVRTGVRLRRA